eukprot:8845280-Pyramimonas_sp.AAC.1
MCAPVCSLSHPCQLRACQMCTFSLPLAALSALHSHVCTRMHAPSRTPVSFAHAMCALAGSLSHSCQLRASCHVCPVPLCPRRLPLTACGERGAHAQIVCSV